MAHLKKNKRRPGGMEHNLMTIKDVARYLQMAEQTIQRYVLKKEIPYHKVKKVIRFRFCEIERWVNSGGLDNSTNDKRELEGDLFAGTGAEAGEDEGEHRLPAVNAEGQEHE
jgi:excisionase family DNA binding protein